MYLLINFFAATLVHIAFFFVVVKVLTNNSKFAGKEVLYILIATILGSSVRAFVLLVDLPNLSAAIFDGATYIAIIFLNGPIIFLYFFKINAYNTKTAIACTFSVTTIVLLTDVVVDFIYINWFPNMRLTAFMTILEYPFQVATHFLLHITLSFLCALLFAHFLAPKLLKPIINKKTQNLFLAISIACCSVVSIVVTAFYSMEYTFVEDTWSWNVVLVVAFMYIILFAILAYSKFSDIKHENALKGEAILSLQQHMADLEHQQFAIRKFKHDFQNILLPMQTFINNEQWGALERYFSSEVVPSFKSITKDEFTLEALSKIHIPEIKSMLAAKLIWAQSLNVVTTFEADQDIHQISLDSVTLVRMLGIVLDNAVEASSEQKNGELRVGCFKADGGVTFIIQNTCASEMPPLQDMLRLGFSTKGSSRGLGLCILSSLADSNENVFLKTSIQGNIFTQRLSIEDLIEDLDETNKIN